MRTSTGTGRRLPLWAWLALVLGALVALCFMIDWDEFRRDCEDVRGGDYRCFDTQCVCLKKGTVLK